MTAATSKSQDQDEAPLGREALFEQVKESTARNRNFFFIWIAFSLYVIVTTTATTDLQLLLPYSTITLPTVGVQLPLLGYFFVTPWLILVLHFNLLQNLDTHAHKLWQWARYYPKCQPPRVLLQAYIFDFAMLERGATFERITRWAVRFLCYALGPITIGIMLWRFTDYQDVLITLSHLTAFLISTTIVIKARNRLPQFQPETSPKGWAIFRCRRFTLPRFILQLHRGLGIPGLLVTAIVLLETMWILELHFNQNAWLLSELPKKMEAFVPRLVVSPNTSLVSLDDNQKLMAELDGEQDFKIWWEKHGIGADLRDRSLQGAVLRGVDMRKSQLIGAHLQGAMLADTQLQGADISKTQLQDANFMRAQLQRTVFSYAQMQGVNLGGAYLHEADLSNTELQASNLGGAYLYSAKLDNSQLQGANLTGAYLQGASLVNIQLQGGSLIDAHLQGAKLINSHLEGVNLHDTRLQGASLDGAYVQGAIFERTVIPNTPRILGTPLVISIMQESEEYDDTDWTTILEEMSASAKDKMNKALDQAKEPPSPKQAQFMSNEELDFQNVAKGTALELCNVNFEAVRGALLNWSKHHFNYGDIPHNTSKPAEILAEAMLLEHKCQRYRRNICRIVKENDITINNQNCIK